MLWNLLLLTVIGLCAGALARWWAPVPHAFGPFTFLAIGMAGSLIGGGIAWVLWPAPEGQFPIAGLLMSVLGAFTVLWPYSSSRRRV